jgi:hypothetical protein
MASLLTSRRGTLGHAPSFSPASVSGLYAWWKADAITGLSDGASIASWSDSSGNGWTAAQGGGATVQPLYKTGIVNSLPVARFDSDDGLTSSASAALTATSIFVVLRPTSASGTPEQLGCTTGSLQLRLNSGHLQLRKQGVASIGSVSSAVLSTSVFSVAAVTCTDGASGTYAFYVNGAADLSGSHSQTLDAGTRNLGIGAGSDMAEIIIYNVVLSSTNRGLVTAYLGTKYGISVV